MRKAQALLVGLKSVDPVAYHGWDGKGGCWGCELDVDNMARILRKQGFMTKLLKTKEATHDSIMSSLYRAAENTSPGDVFIFYYSGHGGQQPDFDGDELDGKDETLVAYDREIIDDKIHRALKKFKAGTHIVMISDSCNSGTNYRGMRDVPVDEDGIFRPMARARQRDDVAISSQLIHLGGCRDGFTSSGYFGGGAFTMALCEVWDNGKFTGNYEELHGRICDLIRSAQKPQYSEYGPVSNAFRNQRAFSTFIPYLTPETDLSIHYRSWTDTITIEKKHINHTRTTFEFDNPISAVPSGSHQSVVTDRALTEIQWKDLKEFTEKSGFDKLDDAYGAPEGERFYPYYLTISRDTNRKEVKYRSNPNYEEAPEAFKKIEAYLFKLSEGA